MARAFLCSLILSGLLVGCLNPAAPIPTSPAGSTPGRGESSHRTTDPAATSGVPSREASIAVELSRADLAHRLGLEAESIDVLEVESATWPDAGLGCPLPNAMYTPEIRPGFRLILAAAGALYEYHTDTGLIAVPCYHGVFNFAPQPVDVPGLEDPSESTCRFCD